MLAPEGKKVKCPQVLTAFFLEHVNLQLCQNKSLKQGIVANSISWNKTHGSIQLHDWHKVGIH